MNRGLFYDCLQSLKVSQQLKLFTGWGRQLHAQPPTWRTRVSLFVWIITFDLSSMGDPTSSYATAGIALRIIWPRKPHQYNIGIRTGGGDKIYCKRLLYTAPATFSEGTLFATGPWNLLLFFPLYLFFSQSSPTIFVQWRNWTVVDLAHCKLSTYKRQRPGNHRCVSLSSDRDSN
jgi:hypothetical protein